MPYSAGRVDIFAQPLSDAMVEFDINTGRRRAAFLAQVAHESGELRYLRELSSGQQYEGRHDLGNVDPGDGPKYKGGGLLQITGRSNYLYCRMALGVPLEAQPTLIETPPIAARSAAWYVAVDLSTAAGAYAAAVLQTARLTGVTLSLFGANSCGIIGGIETLAYLEE